MSEAISLRLARPDDVDAAIPLIYSSGPDAFDFVFGRHAPRNAQSFLRHAFLDGAGEFGWRNHVVATSGEQLIGIGAGYGGETAWPFMLAVARQIIGHGRIKAPAIMIRGLHVEAVIPPPTDKALFYIAHLGVVPAWRSHGIGAQITRHLIHMGISKGFQRAGLSVSCANPRAQALYERLGFQVTADYRSRLSNRHATVPDHRNMELDLSPAQATSRR